MSTSTDTWREDIDRNIVIKVVGKVLDKKSVEAIFFESMFLQMNCFITNSHPYSVTSTEKKNCRVNETSFSNNIYFIFIT